MKMRSSPTRRFLIWLRKWGRTSKPTEWMTSTAQVFGVGVGVLTAFLTAFIVYNNGFFDNKRSELAASTTWLKIEEDRLTKVKNGLDHDITRLSAERKEIEERIAGLTQKNAVLEAERLQLKSEIDEVKMDLQWSEEQGKMFTSMYMKLYFKELAKNKLLTQSKQAGFELLPPPRLTAVQQR